MGTPQTLADVIDLPVRCHNCQHETRKMLTWLVDNTEFRCPACRSLIDLSDAETRRQFRIMHDTAKKLGPYGMYLG